MQDEQEIIMTNKERERKKVFINNDLIMTRFAYKGKGRKNVNEIQVVMIE